MTLLRSLQIRSRRVLSEVDPMLELCRVRYELSKIESATLDDPLGLG